MAEADNGIAARQSTTSASSSTERSSSAVAADSERPRQSRHGHQIRHFGVMFKETRLFEAGTGLGSEKHTTYTLQCEYRGFTWRLRKRYCEFAELYKSIHENCIQVIHNIPMHNGDRKRLLQRVPPFPSKSWWKPFLNRYSAPFVKRRKIGLNTYLNFVLHLLSDICRSPFEPTRVWKDESGRLRTRSTMFSSLRRGQVEALRENLVLRINASLNEFFECSASSFMPRYGSKGKEGWLQLRIEGVVHSWMNHWFCIKDEFLAWYDNPSDEINQHLGVVLFDSSMIVEAGRALTGYDKGVVLSSAAQRVRYVFFASTRRYATEWAQAINQAIDRSSMCRDVPHLHGSFSPVRPMEVKVEQDVKRGGEEMKSIQAADGDNNGGGDGDSTSIANASAQINEQDSTALSKEVQTETSTLSKNTYGLLGSRAQAFICGRETFAAMADAIEKAKYEIFIAGWMVNPEILLKRPLPTSQQGCRALPKSASNFKEEDSNDIKLASGECECENESESGTFSSEPLDWKQYSLENLLRRRAEAGVHIYVLLYKELNVVMHNDSEATKRRLRKLGPSHIHVIRSGGFSYGASHILWSHHEKLVVIDQTTAFVGGIDLAFGRYDYAEHRMLDYDHLSTSTNKKSKTGREENVIAHFPGPDYCNPALPKGKHTRPGDVLDRFTSPRMPWQDIHAHITGDAARDIARHFISRWNSHKFYLSKTKEPALLPFCYAQCFMPTMPQSAAALLQWQQRQNYAKHLHKSMNSIKLEAGTPSELRDRGQTLSSVEYLAPPTPVGVCTHGVGIQVIRSIGGWSIGENPIESSVLSAYQAAIANAQHFIYIENQFFISNCTDKDETAGHVVNDIAYHIAQRIFRAFQDDLRSGKAQERKSTFTVIVTIPLTPSGGEGDIVNNSANRTILRWQLRTITALYQALLLLRMDRETIDRYISFHGLRTWACLPVHDPVSGSVKNMPSEASKYVTEQVYVHSKLMIVDDRVAIIGSANINDRSLLGDRDSEVCVIINDSNTTLSLMGGKEFLAASFAHDLRCDLFRQHMHANALTNLDARNLKDPLEAAALWRDLSSSNTEIFEAVFPDIPRNSMHTLADWIKAKNALPREIEKLAGVCGEVVDYPMDFLCKEQLYIPGYATSQCFV